MSAGDAARAAPAAVVALGTLLRVAVTTLDPKHCAHEVFDCYNAAAFAAGVPEILRGDALGARMQVVEAPDVLVSRRIAQPRRAWVVGPGRGRRQLASADWLVLRSTLHVPDYLRHMLVSHGFHLRFMHAVAGQGRSVLARGQQLAAITIPVPALAQQQRIARLLDDANALRARRLTSFALLGQLPRALFHDLFGDSALRSTSDPSVPIAELSVIAPRSGKALAGDARGEAVLLGARNVRERHIDLHQARSVAAADAWDCTLADGDVLLARASDGQTAHGACTVVYPGAARWAFDATLIRLRLDQARADPQYVAAYMRSAQGCGALARTVVRRSSPRARIDPARLGTLRVPLPPIEHQREFAQRLAALVPLAASMQRSSAGLDRLIGNLRDRGYAGDLELV